MAQNPMKNQGLRRRNAHQNAQGGSVLTIILIAIALFAALSWALTQGSRGNADIANEQQAKLLASEIIDYGNQVRNAVRALNIKGCSDTQISFDYGTGTSGYENINAPADHSCDVFHPAGAGINYIPINKKALTRDTAILTAMGIDIQNFFTADNSVNGIGNNAAKDLVLTSPGLSLDVCNAINKLLQTGGNNGMPVQDTTGFSVGVKFTGTYQATAGNSYVIAETLSGVSEGCIHETSGCTGGPVPQACYQYYKVLLAR